MDVLESWEGFLPTNKDEAVALKDLKELNKFFIRILLSARTGEVSYENM